MVMEVALALGGGHTGSMQIMYHRNVDLKPISFHYPMSPQ